MNIRCIYFVEWSQRQALTASEFGYLILAWMDAI